MCSRIISLYSGIVFFPASKQTQSSSLKMTTLINQIVSNVNQMCNCNFSSNYFTNIRWICNPNTPTAVIFQADVTGTRNITSGTIAVDIIEWANRAGTVDVGVGTPLGLQGGQISTVAPSTGPVTSTTSTTAATSPTQAAPTTFIWIIGIIAGVIVALILIVVIVVILLWYRRSQNTKNAKLVHRNTSS